MKYQATDNRKQLAFFRRLANASKQSFKSRVDTSHWDDYIHEKLKQNQNVRIKT